MTTENEQTTAHLVRCYGNVQEVLRFLDTKAAVIFTLSGVMLGSLATKHSDWCQWAQFFLGVSTISTILSMVLALRAVWPSHGPENPDDLTLLFPSLNPKSKNKNDKPHDIPSLIKRKLRAPLTSEFIRDEYAAQLSHLNNSLVKKISSLRLAIRLIIVALVSIGICQFGKMDEKEKPTSVKLEVEKGGIPVALISQALTSAQNKAPAKDNAPANDEATAHDKVISGAGSGSN